MTYAEALDYVSSLEGRGWRLGLDRMEAFIRRAGLESALTNLKHIHIAGTNGKGSVTAYAQSMLVQAGLSVGGYFSPYVYDIRERIQWNGDMIPKDVFAQIVGDLCPIADSFDGSEYGGITEFEFKTAMGLAFWQSKGAEYVALEVGLGGRLDATNVVTPTCSVIVNIGYDHMDILGETLGEIAREKAGILKPGRPAVIGDLPEEARQVVRLIAQDVRSPIWEFGREFGLDEAGRIFTPFRAMAVRPPIPGRHQLHNAAVAVAAVDRIGYELDDETVRMGIEATRVPGRFERRLVGERLVILDGAHNAEAMEALAETLETEYPGQRFAVVFGMLQGHDPGAVAAQVERFAVEVHLSPINFRRTRDPRDLAASFARPLTANESAEEAIVKALASDLPVLVTGSFYLVGEVGRYLSKTFAQ